MTDIVERLRSIEDEHYLLACSDLLEEAANEIERLRRMTAAFANPDKIFEFPPAPKSIDPTGW